MEWRPAHMFHRPRGGETAAESTLLILNQPLLDLERLGMLWRNTAHHVAADGGANRLFDAQDNLGVKGLDIIIGDLDSLRDDTRSFYETQPTKIIHDSDQYSTDFAKAVKYVRATWPGSDIVAMGGLGGRVDQGLSQLHHLYLFQTDADYKEGRIYLVSGESVTFLLKPGMHHVRVREEGEPDIFDKYIGILPVGAPSVITTEGLEWDVKDWQTEFGGQISTSNHVLPETQVVKVQTTSDVLFTVALRAATGDNATKE
jgi:thiamine pyrophosphokinase